MLLSLSLLSKTALITAAVAVVVTATADGVVLSACVARVGDKGVGFAVTVAKVTVAVVVDFGALGPWCIS